MVVILKNHIGMIDIDIRKLLKSSSSEMLLDVKVELEEGKLTTIYGVSGAGKSTLLMLLAGLIKPEDGHIKVAGNLWSDTSKNVFLAPQKRNIGLVFQEYALFPNMTVRENLLFGLGKSKSTAIVDQLVEIIDLGELQKTSWSWLCRRQTKSCLLPKILL